MNEIILNTELDFKLAELKRFLPVLVLAPYTRILFLAGSTALGSPRPESDLDLIIVAERNRVWLNRFFLEIITRLFGIRRTKNNVTNKICFNIFLSAAEPTLPHQDFIGAGLYKNIRPIWCDNKTAVEKFWKKNLWIKNFCELSPETRQLLFEKNYTIINLARKFFEHIFDFSGLGFILEKITFGLQKFYLEKRFRKSNSGLLADFWIEPNLIAYHFPVSNYARVAQKMAQTDDISGPLDPQQPLPDQKSA
ncbi:MAG: nucleotidyltransferase domain-containing protein [Patescibacteria group bacterium]